MNDARISTKDEKTVLTVKKCTNGKMGISTVEIADMLEMEHWQILRKIEGRTVNGKHEKGYIEIFNDNQMVAVDYFVKSTYKDAKGEVRPCYLVTKIGCDFLANKFTGEKGVIFSARYVKEFDRMEKELNNRIALPATYRDAIKELLDSLDRESELQAQLDTSKDWYSIKRVAALNGVSFKTFDWRKLKRVGEQMGYEVKKIFDANYGEVNTYHRCVWEVAYPQYEL